MVGTITTALILNQAIARADAVLDWNTVMQSTVGNLAPFLQARFAAITQLAVFEAVNAIKKDYTPYLGTITAPPDASTEAAAVAAAHTVLKAYFPANAVTLDAMRASSLAMIPDGPAKSSGISVGEKPPPQSWPREPTMARRRPGSTCPRPRPGQWQSTPSCTAAEERFSNGET